MVSSKNNSTLVKHWLPAKIRVLMLVKFQKAVTAEPAKIFLCEHTCHASPILVFTLSTAQVKFKPSQDFKDTNRPLQTMTCNMEKCASPFF